MMANLPGGLSGVLEFRDRSLTRAEVERVLELRRQGQSYRRIAEAMDVSRTTILNYVHEFGDAEER